MLRIHFDNVPIQVVAADGSNNLPLNASVIRVAGVC